LYWLHKAYQLNEITEAVAEITLVDTYACIHEGGTLRHDLYNA